MDRLKNVLLYYDPNVQVHNELQYMEALASQANFSVTVLSVVKDIPANLGMMLTQITPQEILDLMVSDYQKKADMLVQGLGKINLEARSLVLVGTPFIEIIRQVLAKNYDLVMLMAEGEESLQERLFGSTSMHLMRKCPCPVWVVKPTGSGQVKRVLAAVDVGTSLTEESDQSDKLHNKAILDLAKVTSNMSDGHLEVIQAWSVFGEGYMESRGGLDSDAIEKVRTDTRAYYRKSVNRLLLSLDMDQMHIPIRLPRAEDASRAIIDQAKQDNIDLLVMGTVCRTGIEGFLIGNTAEKVLNEVDCSVLTVKPKGFVSPVKLEQVT